LAGLGSGEGLEIAVVLEYILHLVVGDCMGRGNHRDRLDCHLCHLEEHRHRAAVVGIGVEEGHIHTGDVAAGDSKEEVLGAAEEEEGSYIAVRRPWLECCAVAARTRSVGRIGLRQSKELQDR
jgi:hypothetical protein